MIAREFPLRHPDLPTISWMIGVRLGVCWLAPAWPTVFQAAGDQATVLAVRGRVEIFAALENATALSAAWPWMVREVGSVSVSSAWNWMDAVVMVAPAG